MCAQRNKLAKELIMEVPAVILPTFDMQKGALVCGSGVWKLRRSRSQARSRLLQLRNRNIPLVHLRLNDPVSEKRKHNSHENQAPSVRLVWGVCDKRVFSQDFVLLRKKKEIGFPDLYL